MAILEVNQLGGGRRGSGGIDGNREYTIQYEVITDGATVEPVEVSADPRLPRIYLDGWATDLAARCLDLDIQEDPDSDIRYIVTAKFGTRLRTGTDSTGTPTEPSSSSNPADPDPTKQPAEVVFDTRDVVKPLERDTDGNPIVNSAGEPFDPPLTKEVQLATISIRKNVSSYNPVTAALYRGAVNSATFLGFPAETLRCRRLRATSHFERGFVYWAIEFDAEYDPDGWQLSVYDRGFRYRDPANPNRLLEAKDYRGQPVSKPVNLTSFGELAPAGDPPRTLDFTIRDSIDFNNLGFFS